MSLDAANAGREPYLSAALQLLRESGCRIRRFRTGTTGVAYTDADDWGIEVPAPRGEISFATFAHEVGHQMLHRTGPRRPRWQEEVEAWTYALEQFDRFGLPGKERARKDAARSLRYAVRKATHHGRPETVERILATMPAWAWDGPPEILRPSMSLERRALDR